MQVINTIFEKYDLFHNKSINHRRFAHEVYCEQILGLQHKFNISVAGMSVENRKIYHIKAGIGKTKLLIWSQMHGNEPTASLALLDLFNFFDANDQFDFVREGILNNCTLHFLPVLNPDGAEKFTRRNALGIDLNRDALKTVAPESKILKKFCDEIKPEFAFNLHDQELYYAVGNTGKQSTIAFLSPSYNPEKEINQSRTNAMKVIADMNAFLQTLIPGQVGRYSDEFMPSAFGDNIQQSGISTVLIESGGYKNDPERQFVRRLNFSIILLALYQISTQKYEKQTIHNYLSIPMNKKDYIFDLLIKNAILLKSGKEYIVDIGISRNKSDNEDFTDYINNYVIWNIGDLAQYCGHYEFDASNFYVQETDNYFGMKMPANFSLINKAGKILKVKNGIIE